MYPCNLSALPIKTNGAFPLLCCDKIEHNEWHLESAKLQAASRSYHVLLLQCHLLTFFTKQNVYLICSFLRMHLLKSRSPGGGVAYNSFTKSEFSQYFRIISLLKHHLRAWFSSVSMSSWVSTNIEPKNIKKRNFSGFPVSFWKESDIIFDTDPWTILCVWSKLKLHPFFPTKLLRVLSSTVLHVCQKNSM